MKPPVELPELIDTTARSNLNCKLKDYNKDCLMFKKAVTAILATLKWGSTVFLAVAFWPVTALVVLWSFWHTFATTKNLYSTPRDDETGEVLNGFLVGGKWKDDAPPDAHQCTNAWMLLLAEAENCSDHEHSACREDITKRAIEVLNFSIAPSNVYGIEKNTESIVPDLLYHLKQSDEAGWLIDALGKHQTLLEFQLRDSLRAANKSTGVSDIVDTKNWQMLADKKLTEIRESIPSYSEADINLLATHFATFIRANARPLIIDIEYFEITSFSKHLCQFEWAGKTVTENGLALVDLKFEYEQDEVPSGSELQDHIAEKWCEKLDTYAYGFIFSGTTCMHHKKEVAVVVNLLDAPEHYYRTISEGKMDYHMHSERIQGDMFPQIIKAKFHTGDLSAIFDLCDFDLYDKEEGFDFLARVKENLERLDSTVPDDLKKLI